MGQIIDCFLGDYFPDIIEYDSTWMDKHLTITGRTA
jgi:hypothetical protein